MSKHVIQCWSCGTRLNLDERNENDGDCIECGVELALDDYLDQAVTENEQLRAELSAIKAGQGEAVAWSYKEYVWVTGLGGSVWREKIETEYPDAESQNIKDIVPLYTAPPASAAAVSVPVELMELEWLEGWLRFVAEPIGQECCGRGGQECCGCPDPVYPGLEDVGRAMDERAKELRALLAQSGSKG